MENRIFTGILLVAVLGISASVQAQESPSILATIRRVRVSAPSFQGWQFVRAVSKIEERSRLQTGREASAKLQFGNHSFVSIGDRSEIELTDIIARKLMVYSGHIYGDCVRPINIASRHGEWVVKGTQFECMVEDSVMRVRCYSGSGYVVPTGTDARAGTAESGTALTLTDNDLVGQQRSWVGAQLRLMSGPDTGAQRPITGFDPASGTVTVGAPFPTPVAPGTAYLLTVQANMQVIELHAGMETTIRAGQSAATPRRTFSREFAGGQEHPWFMELIDGHNLSVYPGSSQHEQNRIDDWALRETHDRGDDFREDFGPRSRSALVSRAYPPSASAYSSSSTTLRASLTGATSFALRASTGWDQSPVAPVGGDGGRLSGAVWELEPYAAGVDQGGSLGIQVQTRFIVGDFMVQGTGRFVRLPGRRRFADEERNDLIQSSLLYRSRRWGDWKIGRQFLYLGPVNNSDLGRLLNFSAVGGVTGSGQAGRVFGWRAGYLSNTMPNEGNGFSGWFGRVQSLVGSGLVGVSLLEAHPGGHLGYAADLSLPLVRYQLDGYMEAGRDSYDRYLVTGGLFFPEIFERTGVQTFLEYQARETFNDRVSLRLRYEVAPRWILSGFFAQEIGGRWSGGIGAYYRLRLN